MSCRTARPISTVPNLCHRDNSTRLKSWNGVWVGRQRPHFQHSIRACLIRVMRWTVQITPSLQVVLKLATWNMNVSWVGVIKNGFLKWLLNKNRRLWMSSGRFLIGMTFLKSVLLGILLYPMRWLVLGVRLFGWVVTMVMIWLLDRGVLVPWTWSGNIDPGTFTSLLLVTLGLSWTMQIKRLRIRWTVCFRSRSMAGRS